jgi:peptidoglycan/LPS O-acetylase OafA/YrhL
MKLPLAVHAPRRILQLDILRGVAILMVMFCHSIYLRQPSWDTMLWRPCWSGVDLFFVLSGFLVSGLLFSEYRRTSQIRFRRFAVRRALKIYPAFYAVLVLTVAIKLTHGASWQQMRAPVFHDLFFVQSYVPGTWGHFWSLSVEEHFYVLLPLALFVLIRMSPEGHENPFTAIPRVFVMVATVLLAARLLTARYLGYSPQTHLYPTHLRLDSLFVGVVIAYYHHFHRERFTSLATRYRGLIFCASALLLAPLFLVSQYDPWMYTYGFTCAFLGYGLLLIGFLQVSLAEVSPSILMCLRAIGYVGTFSYSIYLWHMALPSHADAIGIRTPPPLLSGLDPGRSRGGKTG